MEIKPPGSGRPFFEPSKDNLGVDKKPGDSFVEARRQAETSSSAAVSGGGLTGTTPQFRKADLQDKDKLESLIRGSVGELIDSKAGLTGQLADSQKAVLVDFMSGDPTIRRQIERYMEKVLK